jgi:hypothetical protein
LTDDNGMTRRVIRAVAERIDRHLNNALEWDPGARLFWSNLWHPLY